MGEIRKESDSEEYEFTNSILEIELEIIRLKREEIEENLYNEVSNDLFNLLEKYEDSDFSHIKEIIENQLEMRMIRKEEE
jgi:hypothetical protein